MKKMVVICGKSGSGKNFIPDLFNMKYVRGNTTRQPRKNDPEGIFYWTKQYFEQEIDYKDIVIPTYYCDNYYWTDLEDFNNENYDYCIADLKGVNDLIKDITNDKIKRPIQFIYFKCSLLKRIKNMRSRGDSYKDIFDRVRRDRINFKGAEKKVLNNNGIVLYL